MPPKERLAWGIVALVILLVSIVTGINYPKPPPPPPPPPPPRYRAGTAGTTNLTGLNLSGDETDMLIVNQTSTGDIMELRDNGTVIYRVADGGVHSFEGKKLDLDADDDTSITVDTDDRIDFELGGNDRFEMASDGTFQADAEIDVGTFLNNSAQSTITCAQGATITPTGTYQPITSSGAVTAIAIETSGYTTGDLLYLVNLGSNSITIADTATVKLSGDTALGAADTLTLMFHSTQWIEIAQANN